ncbi:MAG: SapC family protein [Sphingopyxis sp.]|nr:SapC family protein [Sphingopyxis sp.]
MATAPNLPLFYQDLVPLNTNQHAGWSIKAQDKAPFLINNHAIPITIDEFAMAQRFFPIIFSAGEQPVPLALMGLNEGVNIFVDGEGTLVKPVYVPAYIRRYPFLLAKLQQDKDELSLCFDPTAPGIGADVEGGTPLFDGAEPSQTTKDILGFCEQFEQAGARTGQFMEEVMKLDILMDGEVAIQVEGQEQPFLYRGFRMVDEEKLRDLRGDTLRKISQNGILPLLYAHLMSMQLMRDIFAEQVSRGLGPIAAVQAAGGDAAVTEVALPAN